MSSSAVSQYFDSTAARYEQASLRGLWGWQRRREAAAVFCLAGDLTGKSVLDLGCGSGFYASRCLARGAAHVLCVDASQAMLEQLPAKDITAIRGNAETLEMDRAADLILCAGLLEFVGDPSAVLHGARSAVKRSGVLVCLVPPDNLFGRLYRQFHRRHGIAIHLFSHKTVLELATVTGWDIVSRIAVPPHAVAYRFQPSTSA